jgi:hypothetical protein
VAPDELCKERQGSTKTNKAQLKNALITVDEEDESC